jgi:protein-S-isoprenylcysteine O-methyltransferase Ste14
VAVYEKLVAPPAGSHVEEMRTGASPVAIVLGLVALALHLVVGYFVLASGLVAPLWAVLTLVVLWVVAFIVGWRIWRSHPAVAVAVPVVTALIWLAVIAAGGQFLGWTA